MKKKLPNNWRERHDNIIARIAHFQMPQQRPDGTFCPGTDDDHVINTDQVPIWWECHSMNQWGNKSNHARRNVKTGGKEKDRFTCQLTISKSGRKVRIALFTFSFIFIYSSYFLSNYSNYILRLLLISSSRQHLLKMERFVVVKTQYHTKFTTICRINGATISLQRKIV